MIAFLSDEPGCAANASACSEGTRAGGPTCYSYWNGVAPASQGPEGLSYASQTIFCVAMLVVAGPKAADATPSNLATSGSRHARLQSNNRGDAYRKGDMDRAIA
jgi:hypothetical protein